ncbi:hypothetical protein QBC42DRAFT_273785 [Cladorrhinum samala]|uniref:NTF2-like domain-containing protein n=1 Tax=Cladorrhinum samala TaxID=585594 RepID=A0AAV9HIR4_9PEZI|nr:hypothetical protein QBC42DRAFT_273785 [Cladorrhinum samala]
MRFIASLSLLAASLGLSAAAAVDISPRGGGTSPSSPFHFSKRGHCLRSSDVDALVAAYVRMLTKWDDADAVYLASEFRDSSDSINQLAGIPLGQPTFPSKAAFIEHQHVQPDLLPIQISSPPLATCDTITVIWTVTFGKAQLSVRGITILGAIKEDSKDDDSDSDSDSEHSEHSQHSEHSDHSEDSDSDDNHHDESSSNNTKWKIKSIDVEFNNIAYLLNIGGSVLFPGQPCPAK